MVAKPEPIVNQLCLMNFETLCTKPVLRFTAVDWPKVREGHSRQTSFGEAAEFNAAFCWWRRIEGNAGLWRGGCTWRYQVSVYCAAVFGG